MMYDSVNNNGRKRLNIHGKKYRVFHKTLYNFLIYIFLYIYYIIL